VASQSWLACRGLTWWRVLTLHCDQASITLDWVQRADYLGYLRVWAPSISCESLSFYVFPHFSLLVSKSFYFSSNRIERQDRVRVHRSLET
jgi:hypothetical protein